MRKPQHCVKMDIAVTLKLCRDMNYRQLEMGYQ